MGIVQNSETTLPFFIDFQDGKIFKIYLSANVDGNKFVNEICEIIDLLMEKKITEASKVNVKAVLHLREIIMCPTSQIQQVLMDLDISEYAATGLNSESSNLPKPGSYIPLELHHLLQNSLERLNIGEIVAYEVYDPLDEMNDNDDQKKEDTSG